MIVTLTCVNRNEVARVQEEISAQKEEDKRASLAQLAKRKDQELEASRLGWEQKMKDQMTEVIKKVDVRKALRAQIQCVCFLLSNIVKKCLFILYKSYTKITSIQIVFPQLAQDLRSSY